MRSRDSIPPRVVELSDNHGIVVLRKKKELDPYAEKPSINSPSVLWID